MNFCFRIAVLTIAFGVIVFTPNETEAMFNAFKQGAKKAGEAAGKAVENTFNTGNANAGRGQITNQAKDDIKKQLKAATEDKNTGKAPFPLPRAESFPPAQAPPQVLPPKRASTFDPIKPKPIGPVTVTDALKAKGGFGSGIGSK